MQKCLRYDYFDVLPMLLTSRFFWLFPPDKNKSKSILYHEKWIDTLYNVLLKFKNIIFSILIRNIWCYVNVFIRLDNKSFCSFISDPWSKDYRPLILSSDDGPIFDNSLVTNVTAQYGGTAHLPCKVHNIKYADNPVSSMK